MKYPKYPCRTYSVLILCIDMAGPWDLRVMVLLITPATIPSTIVEEMRERIPPSERGLR